MADNTGLTFVDKHIEKVALGAGVLILIISVLTFMTGEKTVEFKIKRKTKQVKISKLDDLIVKDAEAKLNAIKAKKATRTEPIKKYASELANINRNPLGTMEAQTLIDYGIAEARGIKRPIVKDTVDNVQPTSLSEFIETAVTPETPKISVALETIVERFGKDDNDYELKENIGLHAASIIDLRKLQAAWVEQVRGTLIKPDRLIILPVDVEVELQEKQNGQWVVVKKQDYRLRTDKVPPKIEGKSLAEVQDLLTKAYRLNSGWATFKLWPTYKKMQVGTDLNVTWKQVAPFMKDIEKELEAGSSSTNTLPKPDENLTPGLPPVDNDNAKAPAPVAGDNVAAKLNMPKIPTFENQISLSKGGVGKVVSFIHFDNLEYGKEYRVRFRYVLVNPILAQKTENNIKKGSEDDVKVSTIKTPWSKWSKAGMVKREDQFFVTYASKSGQKINVSLFTKILGQIVKTEIKDAVVGQKLAKTTAVKILNPATGLPYKNKNGELPEVNFNTGLTIVEINFSKTMLLPDGKKEDNVVEIVLADRKGNLYRRIEKIDKNSKKLEKLTEDANKVAEKASPSTGDDNQ